LKATPQLALPRNFTLDVARYRRPTPWWARYQTMQWIGALGTAASVVLILLGVALFSASRQSAPAAVSNNPPLLVATNVVAVASTQTATIVPAAALADKSPLPTATIAPIRIATVVPTVAALANKAVFPTATLFVPTLVQTQFAAEGGAAVVTPTAMAKFSAPSVPSGMGAGVMSAQSAQATTVPQPPMVQQTFTPDLAQAQATFQMRLTAEPLNNDQLNNAVATSEASKGVADTALAAAAPSTTPAPTTTSSPTTTIAPTKQEAATEEVISAVPTTAAPAQKVDKVTSAQPPAAPPVVLIIGITLLVFSVMLFGIGWLRSRLRG
jgi:DNA polymerase-3 subunit gamma/tau